jgi:hypothetical protein
LNRFELGADPGTLTIDIEYDFNTNTFNTIFVDENATNIVLTTRKTRKHFVGGSAKTKIKKMSASLVGSGQPGPGQYWMYKFEDIPDRLKRGFFTPQQFSVRTSGWPHPHLYWEMGGHTKQTQYFLEDFPFVQDEHSRTLSSENVVKRMVSMLRHRKQIFKELMIFSLFQ